MKVNIGEMDIEYVDIGMGEFCRQFFFLIKSSVIGQYVPPRLREGRR